MNEFAPIAVFCYNRKEKLKNLIDSIKLNKESLETKIYFFVDKVENNKELTIEITDYLNTVIGFKEKIIIVRDINMGLKNNILEGINYVLEENEKIICLEDDLVVSKYFLRYMNDTLEKFKNEKRIWHINGWAYPQIRFNSSKVVIGKLMNSWGWATWRDRWEMHTERSLNLISGLDFQTRKDFNFGNLTNWEQQLIDNENGKISTWAIFWYQTIFLNKGLTVYPAKSLVINKGMDGFGTNSGKTKIFNTRLSNVQPKIYPKIINLNRINLIFTKLFYFKLNFLKKMRYLIDKIQND